MNQTEAFKTIDEASRLLTQCHDKIAKFVMVERLRREAEKAAHEEHTHHTYIVRRFDEIALAPMSYRRKQKALHEERVEAVKAYTLARDVAYEGLL